MKYGPIHGDVYSLIKRQESTPGFDEWSRHFHTEGYNVVLDADPGVNALSRFEVRTLEEVLKRNESKDVWDLALQTHHFPEYGKTYRKGRARLITLQTLIRAIGLTPMAKSIIRDLREKQELDEMFASAKESAHRKR